MYVSYEVSPVKITGNIVEVVEEKDATMWAVYGRTEDGLAWWIADFSEKEYAQLFYNALKQGQIKMEV